MSRATGVVVAAVLGWWAAWGGARGRRVSRPSRCRRIRGGLGEGRSRSGLDGAD